MSRIDPWARHHLFAVRSERPSFVTIPILPGQFVCNAFVAIYTGLPLRIGLLVLYEDRLFLKLATHAVIAVAISTFTGI